MARIVTISWETTTAQVPGQFQPSHYRANLAGINVEVAQSPAVIELPDSVAAGVLVAAIALIDTQGNARGPIVTVDVTIPDATTACNVPINPVAAVVVS